MADLIDIYTGDGRTDKHKNPAIRNETGIWKAIRFEIGILNETGVWKAFFFTLVTVYCERLAYYGMRTNVTYWSGTCYVMPFLVAFLANAYLGRVLTIVIFLMGYSLETPWLTFPASGATHLQFVNFFLLLYVVSSSGQDAATPLPLGNFFLPLYDVSSFGEDQFDETDEDDKKTTKRFFNFYNFLQNIAFVIAASVLVWVKMNVGRGCGFGIPAKFVVIALISFASGIYLYLQQQTGGSPFFETVEEESAIQGSVKLDHTKAMSLFDSKAAVETADQEDFIKGLVNPWRLCTVTQVKQELKSLPIWASGIVISTVFCLMSTMFVLQGNTMDPQISPSFKITSDELSILNTISVFFWIPVYDRFIVPLARRYTGHKNGFTQLQRIGIGLVISTFAMFAAAVTEVSRLNMAREYLWMSILWQIPQYFLIGCAEVFAMIGQLEFFYDQAPDAMRRIMFSALTLTTSALGNYLTTFFVTIWYNLNKRQFDYYFWFLAVLSVANFLVYLWMANWYTYKKVAGSPR